MTENLYPCTPFPQHSNGKLQYFTVLLQELMEKPQQFIALLQWLSAGSQPIFEILYLHFVTPKLLVAEFQFIIGTP
ncbi:MAG: hypothetical protein KGZ58_10985 [Ignavibacteriales bacterium]|nr:hypothetical protein [Ignavibacteriales bacterium]